MTNTATQFLVTGFDSERYLVEGTKSRGTQGGIGTLWSANRDDALTFDTEQEALAVSERLYRTRVIPATEAWTSLRHVPTPTTTR